MDWSLLPVVSVSYIAVTKIYILYIQIIYPMYSVQCRYKNKYENKHKKVLSLKNPINQFVCIQT